MCVQYRGGDQYRGVFSTVGGYYEYRGGYLEYRGGVQYRGGYHDKCGDIMSTVGVFSTVGYSNNKSFFPHGIEHPPRFS